MLSKHPRITPLGRQVLKGRFCKNKQNIRYKKYTSHQREYQYICLESEEEEDKDEDHQIIWLSSSNIVHIHNSEIDEIGK